MICSIQRRLQHRGFDLCHPIHTSWYNDLIKGEGPVDNGTLKMLPETASILDKAICNALLIGNTKKVWPEFLAWLASQVDLKKKGVGNIHDKEALELIKSPFDTYVEGSILKAISEGLRGHCEEIGGYELFWSSGKRLKVDSVQIDQSASDESVGTGNHFHCYESKEDSFLVSMQRVAMTTGQYWNDINATKLCVHPEYGTWTAFRCVVVFESKGLGCAAPPAAPPCSCPVTVEEIKIAMTIFDYALRMSSPDQDGYGSTLNKSWPELCEYLHSTVCAGSKWDDVPDSMKIWIQLRDCFQVGKGWKYGQEQLLYHYTKDPDILSTELNK
ncbi:LOW QUALITY PROTEIN: hypothetical protein ACHAWF_003802 [Thalassiosira exigua]